MYPKNRVWILRNWTKRHFVRSDGLRPPLSIIPEEEIVVRDDVFDFLLRHCSILAQRQETTGRL
jgi:hypothetical protein